MRCARQYEVQGTRSCSASFRRVPGLLQRNHRPKPASWRCGAYLTCMGCGLGILSVRRQCVTTQLSNAELSVPVNGMTFASCVSHVERAIKVLPGVSNVVVNL